MKWLFNMTSIDHSFVSTKLSQIMADAWSSSSSEQEIDSNRSFRLSSSDGFSSCSSDSSENESRTECGKPATLCRKRAGNQSSEGAQGRLKTWCDNSFIQHICTSASNHGSQLLVASLKLLSLLPCWCSLSWAPAAQYVEFDMKSLFVTILYAEFSLVYYERARCQLISWVQK